MLQKSSFKKILYYYIGLSGTCFGAVLMISSALGLDAWNAVLARLAELFPITLGMSSTLVQGSFWILTCVLNRKINPDCILPIIIKGIMLDVARYTIALLPIGMDLGSRWLLFLMGYSLTSITTGMYIATGYPKMPIDGLNAALASFFNMTLHRSRLYLESSGLIIALAISGNIGIGTLILTGTIGMLISRSKSYFDRKLQYDSLAGL